MPSFVVGVNDKNTASVFELSMANRHGLIAGATGTGKTVTLQLIMENFSKQGIPVFVADIKGDLSGIACAATPNDKIASRIKELGIEDFAPSANPVVFWDLYGKKGHQIRTTLTEMGPLLLGRLLELNNTQNGLLEIIFNIADDEALLLIDIKDILSLIDWIKEHSESLESEYGSLRSSTLGIIQRKLVILNDGQGEYFFGEPALDINELFKQDSDGKGIINILDATKLISDSRLYSTFLLWLLSQLFEELPEVGDLKKPKLAFFFDEAHLLFEDNSKLLMGKIESMVRLIRSKGIGVYFVTQNPTDIPEDVLGQLGNRVQHTLRAFTPKDQKSVKVAAQTFRENPELNTAEVITNLGVGEALVSFLDTEGTPNIVEKIQIYPPESRIGILNATEREEVFKASELGKKYDIAIDRESAHEVIEAKEHKKSEVKEPIKPKKTAKKKPGRPRDTFTEKVIKSSSRTFVTQITKQITKILTALLFRNKK